MRSGTPTFLHEALHPSAQDAPLAPPRGWVLAVFWADVGLPASRSAPCFPGPQARTQCTTFGVLAALTVLSVSFSVLS